MGQRQAREKNENRRKTRKALWNSRRSRRIQNDAETRSSLMRSNRALERKICISSSDINAACMQSAVT